MVCQPRVISLIIEKQELTVSDRILQEVANARTARVLCGKGSCPARTFALMPSLMQLAVRKHTQAVLDIMPRIRRNTWWSSGRNLHTLLVKFANSQSTLERDKIYALLGMSEDASNSETFYPCYLKSEEEVIRDTATFLLCGEVPTRPFLMPDLRLSDLCLPIAQLAGRVLVWVLDQLGAWANRQRGRLLAEETAEETAEESVLLVGATATLLARHLNKGRFEAVDVLMIVAKKYGEAKHVADILSDGDARLFFHVDGSPWRLCVTIVDPRLKAARPVVYLGDFLSIESSMNRPPKKFIERGHSGTLTSVTSRSNPQFRTQVNY